MGTTYPAVTIEMGRLGIRSTRQEDEQVVTLRGELDMSSVEALDDELRRIEPDPTVRRIIVDLSGLKFMDSTGLRAVLRIDARSRSDGNRVVLLRGPETVQRVFQLTGTEDRLPFID
jgi:anti-sigma B factor antagonist/stage II sporulation protein AA (anti-sigma F factor antagonist)